MASAQTARISTALPTCAEHTFVVLNQLQLLMYLSYAYGIQRIVEAATKVVEEAEQKLANIFLRLLRGRHQAAPEAMAVPDWPWQAW